ncbi:MAG TPA: fibronectin type III domain-containing protein [Gemmatimonadaceae bacterium]
MSVRSAHSRTVVRGVGMRLAAALVVIAAFSSCNDNGITKPLAPKGPALAVGANGAPLAIEFFLQAHQDDWQLFFGDRAVNAAQTAGKVVFVYTTAGAAMDSDPGYWQAREQAANASVDTITLGTPGPWACANATVNAHSIYRCTRANTVSYYLRLPNPGDARPNGMSDLRDGRISSLGSVDASATYTSWADLKTTIQGIFAAEIGTTAESAVGIHSPETDRGVNDSDHSDHLATGDLTDAACIGHDFNRFWYIGYQNQYYPQNVFGSALAAKWGTVYAYDHVMVRLMGETIIGTSGAEVWVPRTIVRVQLAAAPPPPPPPPTVPNTPTTLVAGSNGTAINLTWADNSTNEDGFNIERAPDAGGVAGTYEQIAAVGPNVTTYSNTGLDANVRYWYRVVAYNGVGASAYSNEVSGILTTPNAPSGLAATPGTGNAISLSWTDNSADEQGFNIERAPDVGGVAGTYAQIASVGANVRTYSNTGLEVNVRYWYRVVAYNVVGPSGYSNESSAILATPNAPSALVGTAFSGTRIDLSWTDNSTDESGFRVERAPDVGGVAGAYTLIASVAANVVTYSNTTSLVAGTTYWYRVSAYNTIGASAYSTAISAATLLGPRPPTALSATAASGTRINLAWTDNSTDESGFRVERAPDVNGAPGTFTLIASVAANVTTYGNTGLVIGTRYWYRVRAYNGVGNSAYTNIADATTLSLPAAPTNLQAAVSAIRAVDLSWTDNSNNETSFRLERAPDNAGVAGSFSQVVTTGANVTSYQNTGLANSTTYWYRVRAQNSVGNSAFSTAVRVTTLPAVPPSNLVVRAYLVGTTRYADLTWTPGSETRVDVYRAGTRLTKNANNTGGPLSYTSATTLGNSVPYQICIAGRTDAASCTAVVNANY